MATHLGSQFDDQYLHVISNQNQKNGLISHNLEKIPFSYIENGAHPPFIQI